jgi:hypothetical protein
MTKYRNAKNLRNELQENFLSNDEIIDCETIIGTRKDWLLNQNEFNAKQEFEYYLENNTNNESLLHSIISNFIKMLGHNCPELDVEEYHFSKFDDLRTIESKFRQNNSMVQMNSKNIPFLIQNLVRKNMVFLEMNQGWLNLNKQWIYAIKESIELNDILMDEKDIAMKENRKRFEKNENVLRMNEKLIGLNKKLLEENTYTMNIYKNVLDVDKEITKLLNKVMEDYELILKMNMTLIEESNEIKRQTVRLRICHQVLRCMFK